MVVPVLFFTLWPVKGFQYLLPVSPRWPCWPGGPWPARCRVPAGFSCGDGPAALAGLAVRRRPAARGMGLLVAVTAVSLAIPAWARISHPPAASSWPEPAG